MFNHVAEREPRASRITVPRLAIPTEIWMGGSDSLNGVLLAPADLRDAWVIDLAGELPEAHRAACALWLPRVFPDIESVPHAFARVQALAESVAACLSGAVNGAHWEHPADPPARLFVMCQQGLNRSGLVTGLILRALGVSADDTLAAIATRPGALNNRSYVGLVRATWPPP